MPRLENWSVVTLAGVEAYLAPEQTAVGLSGNVYDHPRFENGTKVTTTRIDQMSVSEGTAETASGSKYELGEPSEAFLKWLKDNNRKLEDYEHGKDS